MPAFLITVVILLQLQIPCERNNDQLENGYNICQHFLLQLQIPYVYYNMDNREHVLFLKKMKNNDTCIEVGSKKL